MVSEAARTGLTPATAPKLARRLHALGDSQIALVQHKGAPVACQRGCFHCCHAPVTATRVEALAVAERVESWPSEEKLALVTRLSEYAARFALHSEEQGLRFRHPCPLLKEGKCAVYDVRPLSCRGLTSWDAELCRLWVEDPSPAFTMRGPNFEAVIALGVQEGTGMPAQPLALELLTLFGQSVPPGAALSWRVDLPPHRPKPDPGIDRFAKLRFTERFSVAFKSLEPVRGPRQVVSLTVPSVYETSDQVEEAFAGLQKRIDAFDPGPNPRDAYDALEMTNFLQLAYSNQDLKPVMARIGRLIEDSIARPLAPDLMEPMPSRKPGRIRVGFISNHLGYSSATRWAVGWLKAFDQREFETFAIKLEGNYDVGVFAFRDCAEHFLVMDGDRLATARAVRELDLDYLVYPDLGEEGVNLQLACFRLARRQAAGWGCPSTSGLPQIDEYLSNELAEPSDAARHYTESLVTLPHHGVTYARPRATLAHRGREDFGLPAGPLVVIAQNLSKWLPAHDGILAQVSQAHPNGIFAFEFGSWITIETTKKRWAKAGVRVTWLPIAEPAVFHRMAALFDLGLDAPDFHGGHTSMVFLSQGTPVLSLVGGYFRSRMGLAFQSLAGIPDFAVSKADEYVRLACSPDAVAEARARLRPDALFDDPVPAQALSEHISAQTAFG